MSETRTATDVLLSIEQKLEKMIGLLQTKDLSDKILSNKLNTLISLLSQEKKNTSPVFTAEAVNTSSISAPSNISVSSEDSLNLEAAPSMNGFSRTSRPETFSGDSSYLKKPQKKDVPPKMPVQVPKGGHVEIVIPKEAIDVNKSSFESQKQEQPSQNFKSTNTVSVIQRVTDKNGKSLFLADVEVINKDTLEVVQKLKTNATGKWMCSLLSGDYNIIIKKRDPITKQLLEVGQNIQVTGTSNPLELPLIIIKG